jgi:hypothetical protein
MMSLFVQRAQKVTVQNAGSLSSRSVFEHASEQSIAIPGRRWRSKLDL